jgi:uncharacterized phage-associated protein
MTQNDCTHGEHPWMFIIDTRGMSRSCAMHSPLCQPW